MKGETNWLSEIYAALIDDFVSGPVYIEKSLVVTERMNAMIQFHPNSAVSGAALGFLLGSLFFTGWFYAALAFSMLGMMTGIVADGLYQIAYIDALVTGTGTVSTNGSDYQISYFGLSYAFLVWLSLIVSRFYPPKNRGDSRHQDRTT